MHTLSVVFTGTASGHPVAADDAAAALVLSLSELHRVLDDRPARIDGLPIVFDHAQILRDYLVFIETGRRPRPV